MCHLRRTSHSVMFYKPCQAQRCLIKILAIRLLNHCFLTNISLYTVTEALGRLYGIESWFKSTHLSYAWKLPIFIWSGPNSYMLDTKSYQSCNRLAFWHFISSANIFIMALMECLVSAAGNFIFFFSTVKALEPGHSISFKIACAPSKTKSSLRIRAVWLESSRGILYVAKDRKRLQADSTDSDHPAWLRWMIWVFSGYTCNLVGNNVTRLILLFI